MASMDTTSMASAISGFVGNVALREQMSNLVMLFKAGFCHQSEFERRRKKIMDQMTGTTDDCSAESPEDLPVLRGVDTVSAAGLKSADEPTRKCAPAETTAKPFCGQNRGNRASVRCDRCHNSYADGVQSRMEGTKRKFYCAGCTSNLGVSGGSREGTPTSAPASPMSSSCSDDEVDAGSLDKASAMLLRMQNKENDRENSGSLPRPKQLGGRLKPPQLGVNLGVKPKKKEEQKTTKPRKLCWNQYAQAALQLLQQSSIPLSYKELTKIALAKGFIIASSSTPEASMSSALSQHAQRGVIFKRVGAGTYDLIVRDESIPTGPSTTSLTTHAPNTHTASPSSPQSPMYEESMMMYVSPSTPLTSPETAASRVALLHVLDTPTSMFQVPASPSTAHSTPNTASPYPPATPPSLYVQNTGYASPSPVTSWLACSETLPHLSTPLHPLKKRAGYRG